MTFDPQTFIYTDKFSQIYWTSISQFFRELLKATWNAKSGNDPNATSALYIIGIISSDTKFQKKNTSQAFKEL